MTRTPAVSILAAALMSSMIICASVQRGAASQMSPKAPTALPYRHDEVLRARVATAIEARTDVSLRTAFARVF
jgi:hypothetical protein